MLNVAVGGTIGFIPDDGINQDGDPSHQKPWSNTDSYENAMRSFYNNRHNWNATWTAEADKAAMMIDYIRVYQEVPRAGKQ